MKRTIRKFRHLLKLIGLKEAIIFMVAGRTKRKEARRVSLGGEEIYVRTATTDLIVAESSLINREYDSIQSDDPSVIVDAGANIGASAIYFAKRFPNAKIYAIEPERENYEMMVRNTARFKNIIPIHAALWGSAGPRTIQNRFTGTWGFTVTETTNRKESTGQQIDCITMDSFLKEYRIDSIDILKMDIEGGEKEVLEGADRWMAKVKIITAELHDKICMGCDRAFYLATKEFTRFEKFAEKVTAYRQ